MPANPAKVHCSHPGCRAWAMRGSEPPICSVHAGRPLDPAPGKTGGAQPGNDNALVHGLYANFLRDITGQPVIGADSTSLEGEIAITRVALHRILTMLVTGITLSDRPQRLAADDIARLIALAFQGARTISRLLEVKGSIGAAGEDKFSQAINQALDQLAADWGVNL